MALAAGDFQNFTSAWYAVGAWSYLWIIVAFALCFLMQNWL
jgi:hypothetical protein